MGERGPLRKPTALRLMEGNRSHRPLPEGEPQPRDVIPSCPKNFPPRAVLAWKKAVNIMRFVPGWLTEDNFAVLERWSRTYARLAEVEEFLDKEGLTYEAEYTFKEGPDQEVLVRSRKRQPETILGKEYRDSLRRDEAILGLGNALRPRVNISGQLPTGPDEDPA